MSVTGQTTRTRFITADSPGKGLCSSHQTNFSGNHLVKSILMR